MVLSKEVNQQISKFYSFTFYFTITSLKMGWTDMLKTLKTLKTVFLNQTCFYLPGFTTKLFKSIFCCVKISLLSVD